MCLSFDGYEARGLLRGRFVEEGRLVRLSLRRPLVRLAGRVVGRPFLGRWRYLGRRLWVARVVIVVATGFESVVIAGLMAAVIAMLLALEAVLARNRQQERSLAERTGLVWTAEWIVHSAAVPGLRSAMRRWW